MRVLGRVRLSRATEESTSVERQREIIQQWADASDHTVVGWAEDIDVSGSVDPFDTPQLGPWLGDRAPEWDALVAWKLDRLGRNAIQLSKLFGWAQDHGKTVVSCSESIDLTTWAGRMLASVIAGLAEGELEAIRERQKSSRAKLRQTARWPGGKPPYGYSAVKGDAGWILVVDEEAAAVVRRVVGEVIDGKGLASVAKQLTAEGYLTPSRYYATVKAGAPMIRAEGEGSGTWKTTALRNMLRSRALRGFAHHKGETVRDADGAPVELAPALITGDEWQLLQGALDRVQEAKSRPRPEASPLSGVVFCLDCGGPLHHDRTSVKRENRIYVYRYYRSACGHTPMIRADDLEQRVEAAFLDELGDVLIRERVWVPGDARETDRREAIEALDDLAAVLSRAASETTRQRLQMQIEKVDRRLSELDSQPAREARWEYRPTGGTYGSAWETADAAGRRQLLMRSGITIAARQLEAAIRVPPEIWDMAGIDGTEVMARREAAAVIERASAGVPEPLV
ncbi:recombinase family protein [Mycobacterium kyogaense]|uniref:recombinase family protein n=1 Tax=Mycobacterium kyogaense TaxID=2212479 RepID=UPI001F0914A9|nr:recombinase family protein [Mycobacterium kyogaense]